MSGFTIEQAAEPLPHATGSSGLAWRIKDSFVRYIAGLPDGRFSVSDGAAALPSGDFFFEAVRTPPTHGDSRELLIRFRGTVVFSGHAGILHVRIADPWLQIRGSTAEISIAATDPADRIALAGLDLLRARDAAGAPVVLLGTGVEVFGDVYDAGEPLEPLALLPAPSEIPATAGRSAEPSVRPPADTSAPSARRGPQMSEQFERPERPVAGQ